MLFENVFFVMFAGQSNSGKCSGMSSFYLVTLDKPENVDFTASRAINTL